MQEAQNEKKSPNRLLIVGLIAVIVISVVGFFSMSEKAEQRYKDGYAAGQDVGYSSGLKEGYDTGYTVGHDIGYDSGYDDGYEEGNSKGNKKGNTTSSNKGTSTNNEKTYTYILNTNTKKFHYTNCYTIKQMKESNKLEYKGTRSEVINKGYTPCKKCNP